jgi:hypothetical protein
MATVIEDLSGYRRPSGPTRLQNLPCPRRPIRAASGEFARREPWPEPVSRLGGAVVEPQRMVDKCDRFAEILKGGRNWAAELCQTLPTSQEGQHMRTRSLDRVYQLGVLGVLACLGLVQADAADERPDFTGVWTNYVEPGQPPGGRGAPPALPLTETAKKKVAEYRALVDPTGDTPGGHCLGTGMPGSMLGSGGYPMEIHQRPEQIIIVYEAHSEIRRVYLGDRIVPEADRIPGRNGHSSGRWEGDALVVETTHLVEQVDQRYPHSDQARIVERYRMTTGANGAKVLVAEMTMTDPVFYTRPATAEKKWALVPNGHLLPYECAEEEWHKHLEQLEKNKKKN